ncbi:MAG: MFS transporter [Bacteroidales bacterium]|nr:MFS transporter [Bacteroidales bacterium]MBK7626182.1 MFS transporter [Bacteroidales bacterium]
MTSQKINVAKILPVVIGFFVMGFVDLVGIATNYVKADFQLTDTMANLLPSMVFFWFLVFSVPTGLLMNRIGRKNTVLLSLLITLPALLIPILSYSFPSMLISFTLLGIGNTMMQVSLNPLLANIVDEKRIASTLTFGQFVKAIASFVAPIFAAWAVIKFSDWRMIMYPVFLLVCLFVLAYLFFTKVEEKNVETKAASFSECFSLLGDKTILLLFLGIMTHVGLDVGINTTAPKLLMERLNISLADAGYATSFYFIFRTTGCLLGSALLAKFTGRQVFMVSVIMILTGILCLFTADRTIIFFGIALFGLGNSNIFSVMFSQALINKPLFNNQVSGLMIMGVFGGAVFPLIMGVASDFVGGQTGAVFVLLVLIAYLLIFVSQKIKSHTA